MATALDMQPIIEEMLEILSDESKWCKEAVARGADGEYMMSPTSPDAAQWCLLGAHARASYNLNLCWTIAERMQWSALFRDHLPPGYYSVPIFNNAPETSFEDIRLWLKGLLDQCA